MRNKPLIVLASAFASLMLAMLACNGGRPPAQPTAQQPTQPPTPFPVRTTIPRATLVPEPTIDFISTLGISTDEGPGAAVVTGFFDALNAGDIDAALAFTEDSLIYSFGTSANDIGQDTLRTYLTSSSVQGLTYTVSNMTVTGGSIVNFSVQVSDGTNYPTSQAMLGGDTIAILTLR